MASRSDFESDYEWREWLGEVGDFDTRATECIRITYETEIKREIEVSFINLLCLAKSIYIFRNFFISICLHQKRKLISIENFQDATCHSKKFSV